MLRMKDTPPISQIVVGQVRSLRIAGKIFTHGRLDCYCSFAKIQDKTKNLTWTLCSTEVSSSHLNSIVIMRKFLLPEESPLLTFNGLDDLLLAII